MKKIIIVSCTTATTLQEFELKPLYKSIEKFHKLYPSECFDFVICKNNQRGLPEVYNEYILKEEYANCIIVFVHDDVELKDLFLYETLNNSEYDVIGLAGCKKISLSKPPAWHLMCERTDMVGEVQHIKDGKIWTSVFGPTKSRALLIDGLFIAVNVEKIRQARVKFNENFKFHHYDLSFCLECNKNKVSIGVEPINVVHHGLGDSMHSQEWIDSAKIFKKIYGS